MARARPLFNALFRKSRENGEVAIGGYGVSRELFFKMGDIEAGFYVVRNDPIEEGALMMQKTSRNHKGKILD